MAELSIIIPSRNEVFLSKTVESILENSTADTEVIAVCDGYWPSPPVQDHPKVHLIHYSESVGQRAACNIAARLSRAKYIMKVDAHCAFDRGFDEILLRDMHDDWTVVPLMRNLHAFDWKCEKCGTTRYQGPSGPCVKCGNPTVMDIKWIGKNNPQSTTYCFDSTPHFQYFNEFKRRPGGKGDLTETMSLQGSCWMLTKDKYFELNICDEALGSWGSQGIEVAVKTWLSGGRVMCNHKTWYAHMFRTQGKDFGFPYPISGKQVEAAKGGVRELFFHNRWPKQIRPLSWLVEKFWPVPGWSEEDLQKVKKAGSSFRSSMFVSIPAPSVHTKHSKHAYVYYTDNRLDPTIMGACQRQIAKCANGCDLVSVSLSPIDFGRNIVLPGERGALQMFRQILAGVEAAQADIVWLVEHDILYHPSHFQFEPERKDLFYYNQNIWKVQADTGKALFYYARQTCCVCGYRDLFVEHYRKRVKLVEEVGYSNKIGYEPGAPPGRVDHYGHSDRMSEFPNIDIHHGKNLTPNRWSQDQFRRKPEGWIEADEVPGWGVTRGRFHELLCGR